MFYPCALTSGCMAGSIIILFNNEETIMAVFKVVVTRTDLDREWRSYFTLRAVSITHANTKVNHILHKIDKEWDRITVRPADPDNPHFIGNTGRIRTVGRDTSDTSNEWPYGMVWHIVNGQIHSIYELDESTRSYVRYHVKNLRPLCV